jgi:hypothetical protein
MNGFFTSIRRLFTRKKRVRSYIGGVARYLFERLWLLVQALWHHLSGEAKRQAVMAKLRKADIILASPRITTLSPIALSYRLVLRSRYVHSMLYIGDGRIVHTTAKDGVVVSKLPRSIFSRERYAIFRVKNLDPEKRDQVVAEALKWRNRKLNYAGLITAIPSRLIGLRKPLLMWERTRIWCSKLVYKAFSAENIELVPPEKAESITSEDLSRSYVVERV